MSITLILGGARSGKSRHAETLALASGKPVTVIVTATANDEEMAQRIARHQQDRPVHWQTVEAPLALGAAIAQHATPDGVLIVDCLTLWLANTLFAGYAADGTPPDEANDTFVRERESLLAALAQAPGTVLLVSNEVGLGLVPLGAGNRRFIDEAGWLNQALARQCEQVLLVAAGLPLRLKG